MPSLLTKKKEEEKEGDAISYSIVYEKIENKKKNHTHIGRYSWNSFQIQTPR